jgi:hypothetical protein
MTAWRKPEGSLPEPGPVTTLDRIPSPRVALAQRQEARLFALMIVRDPVYRANLLVAAQTRTIAPAVEIALLAYAYGKPTERVEVGRPGDFSDLEDLSPEQLAARAQALVNVLVNDVAAETPEGRTDAAITAADAFTARAAARRERERDPE